MLFYKEIEMDILFDLPVASVVLPVVQYPLDVNPIPAIMGTGMPNPPPQPK